MSIFKIAFPGDSESLATFGGTTHYFIDGLRSVGVQASGLNLKRPPSVKLRRLVWNFFEFIRGRGLGGYQYSEGYLSYLWRNETSIDDELSIYVNLFQLYCPSFFRRSKSEKVFYIDQTLIQLFEFYPESSHISNFHRSEAIREEKYQYCHASAVFCMCQWAADSVINDYGVDSKKVHVIFPGANLNSSDTTSRADSGVVIEYQESVREKIKFLFVGKDPKRKGLFRFIDALCIIPDYFSKVELAVIGCSANDVDEKYRQLPFVRWYGLLDKIRDAHVFEDVFRTSDVGVLLSSAEATGISLREFQFRGLGVIAPLVGGAPEMVEEGCGVIVKQNANSEEIANIIMDLVDNPIKVKQMKERSLAVRSRMTWEYSAASFVGTI